MFVDLILVVIIGVLGFVVIMMGVEFSNHFKEIDLLQTKFFILKDKIRELENRIWTLEISVKTFPEEGGK